MEGSGASRSNSFNGQREVVDPFSAFSLEDLPSNLKPISLLVEVASTLEQIKQAYKPKLDKEKELEQVIRNLKRGDTKIFTCSNTLELICGKLQSALEREEILQDKVEKLEAENF